jgi:hypothetical protein
VAVYYSNSGAKRRGATRRSSGEGSPLGRDRGVEIDPIIVRGAILWTSQRAGPSLDPHLVEGGFLQAEARGDSPYIERRIGRWRIWPAMAGVVTDDGMVKARTARCQSEAACGELEPCTRVDRSQNCARRPNAGQC